MKVQCLQVGPLGTNCYLLCDEETGTCAVVDPGGDAPVVAQAIRDAGCTPCAILLTHGHYDHTGAVEELQALYPGLPAYLNSRDVYGADNPRAQRLFHPLRGDVRDYDEGDTVAVGSLTVSVLATPGHSAGSVTLLCGDAMFSGDTLFAGSCGRTDFYSSSPEDMVRSLRRLGRLEGNFGVYPGHMDTSTLDWERQHNPFLRRAMRDV